MANAIVSSASNQMGSTHHSKTLLGNNFAQDQTASYRLAQAALFTIHAASPSFETGPRHSDVSLREIEEQRLEFVHLYGNSFGQ